MYVYIQKEKTFFIVLALVILSRRNHCVYSLWKPPEITVTCIVLFNFHCALL